MKAEKKILCFFVMDYRIIYTFKGTVLDGYLYDITIKGQDSEKDAARVFWNKIYPIYTESPSLKDFKKIVNITEIERLS